VKYTPAARLAGLTLTPMRMAFMLSGKRDTP
jgi:hypothetical protein